MDCKTKHIKERTEKLTYVACSRAEKNLKLFRMVEDEVEEQELIRFFGKCNTFMVNL